MWHELFLETPGNPMPTIPLPNPAHSTPLPNQTIKDIISGKYIYIYIYIYYKDMTWTFFRKHWEPTTNNASPNPTLPMLKTNPTLTMPLPNPQSTINISLEDYFHNHIAKGKTPSLKECPAFLTEAKDKQKSAK